MHADSLVHKKHHKVQAHRVDVVDVARVKASLDDYPLGLASSSSLNAAQRSFSNLGRASR